MPPHTPASVCACVKVSGTFYVCLYLCVGVGAGGMNPNEIFYGPVDLLIVPQVLSLLTPNLFETTCWVWFFSPVSSPPPALFLPSLFSQGHLGLVSHNSYKLTDTYISCFSSVETTRVPQFSLLMRCSEIMLHHHHHHHILRMYWGFVSVTVWSSKQSYCMYIIVNIYVFCVTLSIDVMCEWGRAQPNMLQQVATHMAGTQFHTTSRLWHHQIVLCSQNFFCMLVLVFLRTETVTKISLCVYFRNQRVSLIFRLLSDKKVGCSMKRLLNYLMTRTTCVLSTPCCNNTCFQWAIKQNTVLILLRSFRIALI